LRYFNVYGPRQDAASPYAGVISKFAAALLSGAALRVLGDGQQTRDFVYVKDVAWVNLLALTTDFTGVCNVGTGRSVTLLELIATLEQVAGRKLDRRFEPVTLADIRASAMSPERLTAWFGEAPSTPLAMGLSLLLTQALAQ
jgi:UDP-glucose 4-epimerase